MKVPFFDLRVTNPVLKKELIFALEKVMRHGKFFLGPEVEEFENKIAKEIGVKYALGVGSGSSALYLALKSLGIGKGDEVITTPLTWIITVNAIASCGATPVFADVREDFNIDPISIEKRITNKTKAIVPMHYAGHICDMEIICKIAKKKKLFVVEDAAQAFGGMLNGKRVGSFSKAAGFSMNPMKVLGGFGEAGVVVTNEKKVFEQMRILRHAGTTSDPKKKITNNCLKVSLNHKMDTINAAFLLVAFRNFRNKCKIIKKIANRYDNELPVEIKRQPVMAGEINTRYAYPIKVRYRDKLIKFLKQKKIETKIYHEPLACDAPVYKKLNKYKLPKARKILKDSLLIPLHEKLTKKQLNFIISSIKEFASIIKN